MVVLGSSACLPYNSYTSKVVVVKKLDRPEFRWRGFDSHQKQMTNDIFFSHFILNNCSVSCIFLYWHVGWSDGYRSQIHLKMTLIMEIQQELLLLLRHSRKVVLISQEEFQAGCSTNITDSSLSKANQILWSHPHFVLITLYVLSSQEKCMALVISMVLVFLDVYLCIPSLTWWVWQGCRLAASSVYWVIVCYQWFYCQVFLHFFLYSKLSIISCINYCLYLFWIFSGCTKPAG